MTYWMKHYHRAVKEGRKKDQLVYLIRYLLDDEQGNYCYKTDERLIVVNYKEAGMKNRKKYPFTENELTVFGVFDTAYIIADKILKHERSKK